MSMKVVALTAAISAIISASCSPRHLGSDELARVNFSDSQSGTLSQEQIESARILTEGITGELINLNSDALTDECPSQLSRWNSAIGFSAQHNIALSGFHATAEDALLPANLGLPETIRAFVCFDTSEDRSGARKTNVRLIMQEQVSVEESKATFTVLKSGGEGYTSALSLEVTVAQFEASAELEGRTATATYYAVDSIKLVSANKEDEAEIIFGRKESDMLQVEQNLKKFLQDNPIVTDACSNSSAQEIPARFTFDSYQSELARLFIRNETDIFTTHISVDGQPIKSSHQKHDLILSRNSVDLTFALAKAGRYTFHVMVPNRHVGSVDLEYAYGNPDLPDTFVTEIVSIDFRIREKSCMLEWIEAINPAQNYTLEKR